MMPSFFKLLTSSFTVTLFTLYFARVSSANTLPADSYLASWTGRTLRPASALGAGATALGAIFPSEVAFDWESTSVTVALTKSSTTLSVRARLAPNLTLALRIYIDAILPPARIYLTGPPAVAALVGVPVQPPSTRVQPPPPLVDYVLTTNLDPSISHIIKITNAVEPMHIYENVPSSATLAPPAFALFTTDGDFSSPPSPPSRTLLVIGDSQSAGSGAIGIPPCHGDIHTTDVTVTYSTILAANFSARLLGVHAISGIGVLQNCCDNGPTMATRAHGILGLHPIENADWNDPTRPQAIIINLGTNDFFHQNATNVTFVDQFVTAYTNFVIDLAYNRLSNGTIFFLGVGPITDLYGPAVNQVISRLQAVKIPAHYLNFMGAQLDGCDTHPGIIGHNEMAILARPNISTVMGWDVNEEEEEVEEKEGSSSSSRSSDVLLLQQRDSSTVTTGSGTVSSLQQQQRFKQSSFDAKGPPPPPITIIVRSDGSGAFTSVASALASCNASGNASSLGHVTIHLLGIFYERIEISSLFTEGVTLIGDGSEPIDSMIIYDRGGMEYSTWFAHTVRVAASNVSFINVAIANNASNYDSNHAGQAPALHLDVTSDFFACFNCALYGAQDTLYTGGAGYGVRSYFLGGTINGSTDSIFGGSSSVFENVALSMSFAATAPRGEASSAYLFINCTLHGPSSSSKSITLLGRPWGQLSTCIWINTTMSQTVEAIGWSDWEHDCSSDVGSPDSWCAPLLFAEYESSGSGGTVTGRAPWAKQLTSAEAATWTRQRVLRGWEPLPEKIYQ